MKIKNMLSKIKNVPKKYLVAIAATFAIALPVLVSAGYGPNRPVFDWNNPDDRKGSLTGPVFNSFINTPAYGDERAFVDAKDATNTNFGGFADTVNVEAGKEYTIRAYVHNNANQSTNDTVGVAKNTTVRFKVLPGMANGNEVTGYISADNATPQMVYDTVKLKNDQKAFALEFVPGSARIVNNAHPYPGLSLSDEIVNSGVKVGYDQMNGNWPGCFEYDALVTIKVKVKAPDLEINKRVSKVEVPKLTDSSETVTAKPGETVSWRIDYKNTGSEVARDVTIRDAIPAGLTLVPGSIKWVDVNHQSGETLQDTALGSGGVNVGNYASNGNGVIRFRTTVNKDVIEKGICEIKNVAYGRAENIPENSDDAKIVIEDCEKPKPEYACDLLVAEKLGDKKYRFTANASAVNGATIRRYMFNFGDGTQVLNTDKNVVEHTYTKTGNFLAVVKVEVNVNGTNQIAESAACTTPIAIGVPPVTPPTTPPVLPNTGAGDVIGIFAAVTAAGAIAHRFILSRRYS